MALENTIIAEDDIEQFENTSTANEPRPDQDEEETTEFLTLRGRRIAYRTAGAPAVADGPSPVILAHASASHSGQWRPLIAQLSRSRRVLAPDLHGYGRSDPLPDRGGPAYLFDAAILSELLMMQPGPSHVVGHGFGGLVAARVARDHPELVRSLTLIEPAAFQLLEETSDLRRVDLIETAAAVTALVAFDEPQRAARLYIDFWNGEGAFDALGPEPQAYVVGSAKRIADDFRAANLHAPAQMTYRHFQEIETPLHLIVGGKSRPPARAVVARLRDGLPHATWSDVIDAGHMAAATQPDRVNPIIMRFINAFQ